MQFIQRLGDEIERAFAAVQYDERQFPLVARQALESHQAHREFTISDLVRWVHSASQVPTQYDTDFGEPPVRLYSARRFYIEALFWLDGLTSIHQHEFSGAFQILTGGSLHTCFEFTAQQQVNRGLILGQLRAGRPEVLREGDTRAIFAGSGLIHSAFHLDRPSVTLVVRTYHESSNQSQLHYLSPGIGVSSFHFDARLPKIVQLLEMAFRSELPDRQATAAEFLQKADLHSSVVVLERLAFISKREQSALVDVVCARHPYASEHVRAAFSELRRKTLVAQRRRDVHSADLRFLLALLLNVDNAEDILRLVAERVPGKNAVEQTVEWIREIAGAADGKDGVHGYMFGEVEVEVFRHLLEQRSVDEIVQALAEEYDDVSEQADKIRMLCAAMKETALLRPLLRRLEQEVAE